MTYVGILLAAGRGRRFDPSGRRHKLLAALPDGTPVAVASARAMCAALPRVVAVVGPDSGTLGAALADAGCEVVVCADAGSGMAASLVCAVQHCAASAGWIIGLADMPYVLPSTISALAQALAEGAQIVQPACGGRRGNPAGFGAVHLAPLLALTGDQGARSLLQSHPVATIETGDPGILRDIDLPSDLPLQA